MIKPRNWEWHAWRLHLCGWMCPWQHPRWRIYSFGYGLAARAGVFGIMVWLGGCALQSPAPEMMKVCADPPCSVYRTMRGM